VIRWTLEAKADLYALWKAGTCASEISDRLAETHRVVASRNAVIGVAFRAGLAFQGPRSPESLAAARLARRAARPARTEDQRRRDRERKAAAKAARPAPTPRPRPEPARPAEIPVSLRIPLMAIRDGSCRFIADDPRAGPATCCGHPSMSGSAWCSGHHALCTIVVRKAASIWMPAERRAA
jgi:hypothetical protein